MILVLVFVILNTPRLILGIIEVSQLKQVLKCVKLDVDYNISKKTYIFDFFSRFLVILNSSINFGIYIVTGSDFRRRVLENFQWKSRRKGSRGREKKDDNDNKASELGASQLTDLPRRGSVSYNRTVIETHL